MVLSSVWYICGYICTILSSAWLCHSVRYTLGYLCPSTMRTGAPNTSVRACACFPVRPPFEVALCPRCCHSTSAFVHVWSRVGVVALKTPCKGFLCRVGIWAGLGPTVITFKASTCHACFLWGWNCQYMEHVISNFTSCPYSSRLYMTASNCNRVQVTCNCSHLRDVTGPYPCQSSYQVLLVHASCRSHSTAGIPLMAQTRPYMLCKPHMSQQNVGHRRLPHNPLHNSQLNTSC
jgi:hypothetical protein